MLESVEWGEFRVENLFSIQKITRILKKEDISQKYSYPAYSSESLNNGVVGYFDIPEFICDKNNPIYVTFGDHTRSFNIAKRSFSVLDNVKVLLPKIYSEKVLLFIVSAWKKQIPDLGYSRHWKIAKNCVLQLPAQNGQLNLDFMENFVAELEARQNAELEARQNAELEAYLSAAGLKDYILTAQEQAALAKFECKETVFSLFSFDSVFNQIKQGRRLKKDDQIAGNMPFVMAGVTNTGVVGYISNPVARFPKNSITLDIFGNAFYRNYDYGAGDDTGVYWNSERNFSKEIMLFLTTAMQKSVEGKFSYGKKLRSSQSLKIKMKLPEKQGAPDYGYMQTLLSAVQKLVIKDVVQYADKKIAATQSVIRKNNPA